MLLCRARQGIALMNRRLEGYKLKLKAARLDVDGVGMPVGQKCAKTRWGKPVRLGWA